MRYQELFVPTNDAELYRLELIECLAQTLPTIKKQAETILGRKIRAVKPVGEILDSVHFNEGSEVKVAFMLAGNSQTVNLEMTRQLNEYFSNLPLCDIGVIKPVVLQ